MPPSSAAQGIPPYTDTGLGLSLLGTDYERRKHKLKQELQLDYKQYAATKKHVQANKPHQQLEGLSLPIEDKKSVQEKLREERNKEYNLFLQQEAQNRSLRRGVAPVAPYKPGHVQASHAVCIPSPPSTPLIPYAHTNYHTAPRERPTSRRDAATLTEAVDNGKGTGTWVPGHRGRRRWQLIRPRDLYSSEEEFNTDREEEMEARCIRRQDRHPPEYREEGRTRETRTSKAPRDTKKIEAPVVHDQNNNEWTGKPDLQMPDRMRAAARSRTDSSRVGAEFATGLMIGRAEEQTATQLKKEQYKQELLQQIAEQQRNKIREKQLGLRVAVTGATDPEKELHQIIKAKGVNQQYNSCKQDVSPKPGINQEPKGQDSKSRSQDDNLSEGLEQTVSSRDFQGDCSAAFPQLTGTMVSGTSTRATQGVPPLDYFNEDYHRDFSNMLGEVVMPRVTAVPPPAPPAVNYHYKTPHDEVYYYYGARNPLYPNPPFYQNAAPGGEHPPGNYQSPLQKTPPPVRISGRIEGAGQHRASPLSIGEVLAEKSERRRESILGYQEALREQIKEKELQKRREKEEKEHFDAKIEAELMAYNPWGRSGGGAPIRDQNGNLVSNLTQMHRDNEELYKNPVSRHSGHTQSFLMRNGHTSPGDARAPLSHRLSGFNEEGYKEELQKQIEEKKRKQEEERERMRLQDEREEKRLEDQRACLQQEYEEEQRKLKKVQQRMENQHWIHEHKTQNTDMKNMLRMQENIKKKEPVSTMDREEKMSLIFEREPSPPVPTLQKKQRNLVESRPPSGVSQRSSRTERSMSAPSYRAQVPAKAPQQQDDQQEVIRALSALRGYLSKEQKQLEIKLSQTDGQDGPYTPPARPRGQARLNTFESPHTQAVQPSTRKPPSAAASVNVQNIREFNRLKYRDTASREEVCQLYPDAPMDAQSLDVQQQALIHEQQRQIRQIKREEEHDFLDQELNQYHSPNKPRRFPPKDSILPSQSVFIDVYSEETNEEPVHQQRSRHASAQHPKGTAPQRRNKLEASCVQEVALCMDQRGRDVETDAQSSHSVANLNLGSRRRPSNSGTRDHKSKTEGPSVDEDDVLSLRSGLERRVSVDTVDTEPWLQPGTSKANSRIDSPPWLTNRIT